MEHVGTKEIVPYQLHVPLLEGSLLEVLLYFTLSIFRCKARLKFSMEQDAPGAHQDPPCQSTNIEYTTNYTARSLWTYLITVTSWRTINSTQMNDKHMTYQVRVHF